MSRLRIYGDASGYLDLVAPDSARNNVINLDGLVSADSNGDVGIGTNTPVSKLDVNGDLRVQGNFTVDGITTTINSTTLDVDDLNITVASGADSGAVADGAGLTVDGANATLTYVNAGDNWNFNKDLNVNGTIIDDVNTNVRTPRHTELIGSSNHNLTNEGVYVISASSTFSQIIIGDGLATTLTAGTIMTIYNNKSTPVTISRGSIPNMRNAADGDYTNYSTRTLGRNSVTTVTMFYDSLIILTGTDIT